MQTNHSRFPLLDSQWDYSCYYQLRQLRVVSRSLSPAAASTLVHAFVVSHLDYCSAIYEGLPICRLKCLDRVLRTAAHLVGRIPKFGPGLCVYAGCPSLAPLPAAHCLLRHCVGSALHGRFGSTLSGNSVASM